VCFEGLPTEMMMTMDDAAGGGGGGDVVMRECLGNYLGIMEEVLRNVGREEFVKGSTTGLFVLYLPAIRYELKMRLKHRSVVRETGFSFGGAREADSIAKLKFVR